MTNSEDIPIYHAAPDLRTLIEYGDIEAVKSYLQEHSAETKQADPKGFLPIHHAIKAEQDEIAELLIDHYDPSEHLLPGDTTVPQFSALYGKFDLINNMCVWSESLIFRCDVNENSLLHYASFNGATDQWLSILDKGLDPRNLNSNGKNPIDIIIEECHVNLLTNLLKQDRIIHEVSEYRHRYLAESVKRNSSELIYKLTDGADLTSTDWKKLVQVAIGYEKEKSLNALLEIDQVEPEQKRKICNELADLVGQDHPMFHHIVSD